MNCLNFLFYPKNNAISNDNSIKRTKTKDADEERITLKDTVPYTLKLTEGYVINVSDDYSILVASRLPFVGSPLYRFIIKFNGIYPPNRLGSKDARHIASLFRTEMIKLLLNKSVILKNIITDKSNCTQYYADVYKEDLDINNWILENRFAIPDNYIAPNNWIVYKLSGHI
jgi:hypothetical protein